MQNTFRAICRLFYMEYYKTDSINIDQFNNFYKYQRKNFIKVINCILLGENIKLRTEKSYNFNKKNTEFILFILNNFTSKNMKLLRKGIIDKIDSEFIIKLIDGFTELLNSIEIDSYKKHMIIQKTYNHYFYNERKLKMAAQELYNSIECKLKSYNEMDFITIEDKIFWTNHFNKTLKTLLKIYNDIYIEIEEYRKEEAIDNATEKTEKFTKENILPLTVTSEIQEIIENDMEIKKLNSAIEAILSAKAGFIEEQKNKFDTLNLNLSHKKDTIENEILKNYNIDKSIINPQNIDFEYTKKDSKELFNEILKEINKEQKNEKDSFSAFKGDTEKELIKNLINQKYINLNLDELTIE